MQGYCFRLAFDVDVKRLPLLPRKGIASLQVEEHLNGPAEETLFVLSRVAKTISKPHARFAVLSAYLVLVGAAK